MKYLRFDTKLIELSEFLPAVSTLYVEIDDNNKVIREIGVNRYYEVLHKYPSKTAKFGKYGLSGMTVLDKKFQRNIIGSRFEKLWDKEANLVEVQQ